MICLRHLSGFLHRLSFLVIWSICLISASVHFNNSPKYLTKGKTYVFIPLMRFLLQSLLSRSFLDHLRYSFLIFFFLLRLLYGVRFQYSQVLVIFLFSKLSDSFLIRLFSFFRHVSFSTSYYEPGIFFYAKFHSYFLLYIFIICLRVSNSFSFFARMASSIYIMWLIFLAIL